MAKKISVIGGAAFIGSHVVAELLQTDAGGVAILGDLTRGKSGHVAQSLEDPRCQVFADGEAIQDVDALNAAIEPPAKLESGSCRTARALTGFSLDISVSWRLGSAPCSGDEHSGFFEVDARLVTVSRAIKIACFP